MAEQKIQLINAISFAKGTTEPSNREVWWIDDNITGNVYNKLKYFDVDSGSWELVQRTAAQLLLDLKTVDGAGSGLDADTLDGYTAAELLQGEIKLSSGEILVGQLNDQASAKTLSGIATIDINGALSYVANSISHTGLTDIGSNTHAQIDTHISDATIHFTEASIDHTAIQNIGVNTHAQIDSHISSTANPHGVTAAQVGNTTAQWNANSIEGNLTNVGVLGAGQDGQALVWDNATSRFITAAVSSPSLYTGSGTVPTSVVATLTDTLSFKNSLGITNLEFKNNSIGIKGDNILFTPSDVVDSAINLKYESSTNTGLIMPIGTGGSGTGNLNIYSSLTTVQNIHTTDNVIIGGNSVSVGATRSIEIPFGTTYNWKGINMTATQVSGGGADFEIQTSPAGLGGTYVNALKLFKDGSAELNKTTVNDKFEIQTTTAGFLMPRLTTAQMNAIAAPDTHLLIFNTDLNGIYRYNGSAWVALSTGYGIIEVITDSDSGVPTYFTDLQTALETCKTSGSNNVVRLHSDLTITSQININRGGSGTGNGYLFKKLTIDFNGFTLNNNEADTSYCFDVDMGNQPTEERTIVFKNGFVNRTSGTGTHYCLHSDEIENDGHIIMQNMVWYCQNSIAVRLEIDQLDESYKDFGGTIFKSDGSIALRVEHYNCKNFKTISNSSADSLIVTGGAKVSNFEVQNTSTGAGMDIGDGSCAYHFEINTTSGIGIDCVDDFNGECSMFVINTTTGDGIDTIGTNSSYNPRFSHFVINCDDGICIDSNHTNTDFSHFTIINNGTKDTLSTLNNSNARFKHGTVINKGAGNALDVTNTSDIDFEFVDFISVGDSAADISLDNASFDVVFKKCTFFSKLDTSSGHSAEISNSTGSITFMNCNFETINSGANGLYAAAARTISVGNSGFKGMTTPINANVTVSLTSAPDANGNYSA